MKRSFNQASIDRALSLDEFIYSATSHADVAGTTDELVHVLTGMSLGELSRYEQRWERLASKIG